LKALKNEDEERLLIEAAQKDPGRFGDLYEQNFERVYAFVLSRVRNREEAQDLTSDVFHQALANISRFEWRGVPFSAWLIRIASNAISDRSQRVSRRQEIAMLDTDSPVDPEVEERVLLFRLVNRLPEAQRRVISMRFAEQKSIREIADELGRTEGAIKQLQIRALQKLRKQIGDSNG
jgi:RNA polymerase sigma-70 factor (ECF subfamily)